MPILTIGALIPRRLKRVTVIQLSTPKSTPWHIFTANVIQSENAEISSNHGCNLGTVTFELSSF
jgi:hypothetical protein